MRISDWSSDVCSSDLDQLPGARGAGHRHRDQAGSETRGINGLIVVRRDATHIGIGATAAAGGLAGVTPADRRSEEHTSELQSLMRISYAVFCLKKKKLELA